MVAETDEEIKGGRIYVWVDEEMRDGGGNECVGRWMNRC